MHMKLEVKKEMVTVQSFKGRNGIGIGNCVEDVIPFISTYIWNVFYDDYVGWIIYHSVWT